MSVRLIRNTVLVGLLCTAALLLPPQRAAAQVSQCQVTCAVQYGECIVAGGGEALCQQQYLACIAFC